jgi:hypothetical protein
MDQGDLQAESPGRGAAARGIMLGMLLSAPAWLGLGAWIWWMTLAG